MKKRHDKETQILEAICNGGCRTILTISRATGLPDDTVSEIISSADLLPDIKEMRRNEEYELVRRHYKIRITKTELIRITGIAYHRLRPLYEKVIEEISRLRLPYERLINELEKISNKDPIFKHALRMYNRPNQRSKLDFLYNRVLDISIFTNVECARRWNTSRQNVHEFIKNNDLEEITKKARILSDPLSVYKEDCDGMPREELKKKHYGLHKRLDDQGLLYLIPSNDRIGGDPIAYYREHHQGVSRGRLSKIDRPLYKKIRYRDLMHLVPTKGELSRDRSDPLAVYKEDCDGMPREELKKKCPKLYTSLDDQGLLYLIPSNDRIGGDPIAYYREHHQGVSRGRLQLIDKPLYCKIKYKGLIHLVPTKGELPESQC